MTEREKIHGSLVSMMVRRGFPREFGEIVAAELGTEKQMKRMESYLIQAKGASIEEVADEMLSIKEEFQRYRDRKIDEYANMKYTQYLNSEERGENQ